MPRPQSEAEYLASLVPSSVTGLAQAKFGRRTLLSGGVGGTSSSDIKSATGTVTFGSNQSDAVPKAAYAEVVSNFEKANPKLTVKVNTVDHNTFQEQINSYLQGSPDDVFSWFSGFRMRFFASKGLAGDISDIWAKTTGF